MNSVNNLYHYRKSLSTTTYKSRGQRVVRCQLCQLAKQFCICEYAPLQHQKLKNKLATNAGVLLLMYDTEVLKPSNTGKLIADLIPDTFAFLWSRTVPNAKLQAVLDDEQWQPFVVFPKEYALFQHCSVHQVLQRKIITGKVQCNKGKRPLFILLDGSWREAKKMFRKSPYLDKFPVVSFDASNVVFAQSNNEITLLTMGNNEKISNVTSIDDNSSVVNKNVLPRYHIRKTDLSYQFSTAEVTARVLAMSGEVVNSQLLDLWFDVFSYQYQRSVCQSNQGNPQALNNYQAFISKLVSS